MTYESPVGVVNSALEQLNVIGDPQPEIWPHGSQQKWDRGDVCFTLGMPSENFRRQLTIRFGASLEVFLPGKEYQRICRPQVIEAVKSFWNGKTSELNRVVHIEAEAVYGYPGSGFPDLGNQLTPEP